MEKIKFEGYEIVITSKDDFCYVIKENEIRIGKKFFSILNKNQIRAGVYHELGHQKFIKWFKVIFILLIIIFCILLYKLGLGIIFSPVVAILMGGIPASWVAEIYADWYSVSQGNKPINLFSGTQKVRKNSTKNLKFLFQIYLLHPSTKWRLFLNNIYFKRKYKKD